MKIYHFLKYDTNSFCNILLKKEWVVKGRLPLTYLMRQQEMDKEKQELLGRERENKTEF